METHLDSAGPPDAAFDSWIEALERRHLQDLAFPEVTRALRALSSTYVERRSLLPRGAALSGAGKRAAFALFYGPLHYLLVRAIVRALPDATAAAATLLDLGCGTGAAGAAWAHACAIPPRIVALDVHPGAVGEAVSTYRHFGLKARTRQGDASVSPWPRPPAHILAAFTVNELSDAARDRLLARLTSRAIDGDRILIVEPMAAFVARWWREWGTAFVRAGGRSDEWRVRVQLPPIVARLDRAAGLDHRELTGRSLFL